MALHILNEFIAHRKFASPLAIWGKLPSHGDFLRHNTTALQAQCWQDWARDVWSLRPESQGDPRPRDAKRGNPPWVHLEPRKTRVHLADVPIAFVMQPGAMPFAPKHCIRGVALPSSDMVGRSCPLVFFQMVTPGWLRRSWSDRRDAKSQSDMLYWLARIAARTHASDRDWEALVRTVDALWLLYEPDLRQLFGASPPTPSGLQLDRLVREYCDADAADVASGLKGVQHMPWSGWPNQILRSAQPTHAYWQQDMRGGYVNVGERLSGLWARQA